MPRLNTPPPAPAKTKVNGYAVVYNSEADIGGAFREKIGTFAFRKCLKDKNRDLLLLNSHNGDQPLARESANSLTVTEDACGIFYLGKVDTGISYAADLVRNVKNRVIKGASFGFTVDEDVWSQDDDGTLLRTIKAATMHEISPTSMPAYEATSCVAGE